MSAEELSRAVDLFARQVGHWTAPRWAAPVTGGAALVTHGVAGPAVPVIGGVAARSDLVHGLVQRMADLAADAEGEPRRTVPRLDSDLILPDQLRVIAADLLAAGPAEDVLAVAAAEVTAARKAL
jgi:hypothetical protein